MGQTVFTTAREAIRQVREGHTVMVGGFGLVGAPLTLLRELAISGTGRLTVISNNLGEPGKGLGVPLRNGQIRLAIGSYFTSNPDVASAYERGEMEVELIPQGTLVEMIRAAGAGIGGFYTPTAAGTALARGAETRVIDGREHIFCLPLRADVALLRAHRADRLGNLTYRKTARNFNPVMASAASIVIVEVDEVVEAGELDPETVVTPQLYVDYVVPAEERLQRATRDGQYG